jgi:hypothetical protein
LSGAERTRIPASAERLDERNADDPTVLTDGKQHLRIAEGGRLRGCDVGVSDGTSAVLVEGELHCEVGGLDGMLLDVDLLLEDA